MAAPAAARRLAVVQLLPALDAGGVERGTLEVGRALVAAGHRAVVICAGGRLQPQLEAAGIEHLAWPIGRKTPLTLRFVPRLAHWLAQEGIDILHARSRLPAWIGYLAWRSLPGASRPRFVTTAHGLYSVSRYSAIMARGERVIAVSQCVRDDLFAHYRLDPARVTVIPRGVDPAEYSPAAAVQPDCAAACRSMLAGLAGRRILLLPGRVVRGKGHADLVKLLARLRRDGLPVQGLIVGDTTAKPRYVRELHALARRLGVADALSWVGVQVDLRPFYAAADCVLSLSRRPESFGRTVLEALAMGKPVLGYAHGGVGEVLAQTFPPGAVPAGDLEAAAHRLALWLRQPPAVPPLRRYRLAHMLAQTLALYEQLAPARSDPLDMPVEQQAGIMPKVFP